jgi:hypothetical protein
MNDPHVQALHYKVKSGSGFDYANATALAHETTAFRVMLDKGEAVFEMKEHYATQDEAVRHVSPFIRAWEIQSDLATVPGSFRLSFDRADIIDRNPPPPPPPGTTVVHLAGAAMAMGTASVRAEAHVSCGSYPAPPTTFAISPDVESMAQRYQGYREQRESLGAMAYFCLTVVQMRYGNRTAAAQQLGFEAQVLSKLGELTSTKGGAEARKAAGTAADYTPTERDWIERAVKRLIERAGEYAHDPSATRPQITLNDFPTL